MITKELQGEHICWPKASFYAVLSLAFLLLTYMSVIAWKNSQPFSCADQYVSYVNGVSTCTVPMSQLNAAVHE